MMVWPSFEKNEACSNGLLKERRIEHQNMSLETTNNDWISREKRRSIDGTKENEEVYARTKEEYKHVRDIAGMKSIWRAYRRKLLLSRLHRAIQRETSFSGSSLMAYCRAIEIARA